MKINWKIISMVVITCHLIYSLPGTPEQYYIIKTEVNSIEIDGVLDEPFWTKGEAIPLSYETHPGENTTPDVKTFLRMGFDEEYFYFSFEAMDREPSSIRAVINDRDKLDDNDFVSLFLDPFNDSRRAFFFSVNPLGVQQDGIYDEQIGQGDLSWDAIWESKGRITPEGYVVEAAIPVKSLRFPSRNGIQTWRFFAYREYPRSIEKAIHTIPIDQDLKCLLCQADLLTGIEGLDPGSNLEITPTLILNRHDQRKHFPDGKLTNGKINAEVGLDAKWGITTDMTLNMTINPDFSQIEADVAQLDINNRFSIQFPEKRPFFLEGADFFNTLLPAFFSRSIANPDFGMKITGKIKAQAFGLIVARDQQNQLLIPGFSGSRSIMLDQNVTNIVGRYRRDIGENSNFGLLYSGRESNEYYNHVSGIDFFIHPWNAVTIRTQILGTSTKYDAAMAIDHSLPLESFHGNSINLYALYDTRDWNGLFLFENRTKGFRADAGFVPQVDYRRYRAYVERVFWAAPGSWYANLYVSTGGFRRESTSGELDSQGTWISGGFNGPLQLNIWANPDLVWQRFHGTTYRLPRLWMGFDIQPLGHLGLNGWYQIGSAVDFENSRKTSQFQFYLETEWRLGRHFDFGINHRHLRMDLKSEAVLRANLSQLEAAFNVNANTFFKIILQYRHTRRYPDLFIDSTVNKIDRSLFAQFLFSYKLNPQSVIFLGYADNHQGFKSTEHPNGIVPLTQLDQTLFFKLGYAWRP